MSEPKRQLQTPQGDYGMITAGDYTLHDYRRSPLRPLGKLILNEGWKINIQGGRPFTYEDFKDNCGRGSFRNAIHRINSHYKGLVIRLYVSAIGFYCIRGSGVETRTVTANPMVVAPHQLSLVKTLAFLGEQVSGVHDIHLWFVCPELYASFDLVPSERSLDKRLQRITLSKGRFVNIVAHHTGSVSVRVKCTDEPFPRDSLTELLILLEEVWRRIASDYARDVRVVPAPADWIVKVWHFNRDGTGIAGPDFELTFRDFAGVLERYYRRRDGRYRLERIETVSRTIKELTDQRSIGSSRGSIPDDGATSVPFGINGVNDDGGDGDYHGGNDDRGVQR